MNNDGIVATLIHNRERMIIAIDKQASTDCSDCRDSAGLVIEECIEKMRELVDQLN